MNREVRERMEEAERDLRRRWNQWRPDLKGIRLPGINCSPTPEELEDQIFFRWTLWCFDKEGVLRWSFPVEDEEALRFYIMLWEQSEGAYCKKTKLRASYPKLWCYRIKFYRDDDEEPFRSVWQIPVQAGLWGFLWKLRGMRKGREYSHRVVMKKRHKLLHGSNEYPLTLTQVSPIRGDLDGVELTRKDKKLLTRELDKLPPPF